MTQASHLWCGLPDHIIVNILSYLPYGDRARAGSTCKSWHCCFRSPYLWRRFQFTFRNPEDGKVLQFAERYAKNFRSVAILLDQQETGNRDNACKLLNALSKAEGIRLNSLRIGFVGENPFYAGCEFVDELKLLFGRRIDSSPAQLMHVDLSGLTVAFDAAVIDQLSENNPQLESLNVLNKTIVCKVSSESISRLVTRCKKLTDLRLHHSSVTDDVLRAFTRPDRCKIEHLGILCRRDQKYLKDLTSGAWADLSKACPGVRVVVGFDHTCPLMFVGPVMKADIPVAELRLETYTDVYDEVNLAANYYKDSLEMVVLQTRNSRELGESLINLCQRCKKLTSLYVYCVLEKLVVDRVLELCPAIKKKGTFVLKSTAEDEPYIVGVEDGD